MTQENSTKDVTVTKTGSAIDLSAFSSGGDLVSSDVIPQVRVSKDLMDPAIRKVDASEIAKVLEVGDSNSILRVTEMLVPKESVAGQSLMSATKLRELNEVQEILTTTNDKASALARSKAVTGGKSVARGVFGFVKSFVKTAKSDFANHIDTIDATLSKMENDLRAHVSVVAQAIRTNNENEAAGRESVAYARAAIEVGVRVQNSVKQDVLPELQRQVDSAEEGSVQWSVATQKLEAVQGWLTELEIAIADWRSREAHQIARLRQNSIVGAGLRKMHGALVVVGPSMMRDIRSNTSDVVVTAVLKNSADQVIRGRKIREELAVASAKNLGQAMPKIVEATIAPSYSAKTIEDIYTQIDKGIIASRNKFNAGMQEVADSEKKYDALNKRRLASLTDSNGSSGSGSSDII